MDSGHSLKESQGLADESDIGYEKREQSSNCQDGADICENRKKVGEGGCWGEARGTDPVCRCARLMLRCLSYTPLEEPRRELDT